MKDPEQAYRTKINPLTSACLFGILVAIPWAVGVVWLVAQFVKGVAGW